MLTLTPFGAGGLATSSLRQGCGAVQALQKPVDRSTSKRRQQLVELGDGWGVSVVPSPASPPQPSGSLAVQEAMLQPTTALEGADAGWGVSTTEPTASSSGRAAKPVPKKRVAKATPRSPYMNITSEQGMMSLALLQARLASKDGDAMTPEQVMSLKAKVAQSKLAQASSGMAGKNPQLGLAKQKPKRAVFVDDDGNIIGEEEEDEDITDAPTPSFTLSFGEEGTEFTEFDATGAIKRQSKSSLLDINDDDPLDEGEVDERFDDDDDDLDFSAGSADTEGWQQLKAAQRQRTQPQPPAALAKAPARKRQPAINFQEDGDTLSLSARDVEALLGDEGAAGAGMLLAGTEQEEEEQEWGLEEIRDRRSETLMEHLGVIPRRKGSAEAADTASAASPAGKASKRRGGRGEDSSGPAAQGTLMADEAAVQWGGTALRGLPAGVDLEAQEALLARMFKPHKVKQLVAHQVAAYKASLELQQGGRTGGKYGSESKLHRQLRIISGSAAGKRLLSSQGAQTRPMMEKVRAAIFNMILSRAGSGAQLPPDARWLDLFAGTGSVGLEALSRGAGVTHFVEMDHWVVRKVLGSNITTCGFNKRSVVHTAKAEEFMKKAKALPRYAGGAFDFISMCPPYLLVSYPELFGLLEGSPLIHDRTILFVEYPKQLGHQVPATVGPLETVRDRKYGRTWVRVYAPAEDCLDAGVVDQAFGDDEDCEH